jgi:hypothetical protein
MTGGTAIYDALVETEAYVAANAHNERRALVLISDGGENSSRRTMDDVGRAFEWPGAPQLFTFTIADPHDRGRNQEAQIMDSLAKKGGGVDIDPLGDRETPSQRGNDNRPLAALVKDEVIAPLSEREIQAAAEKLCAIIDSQYVLRYSTADGTRDGKFRRTAVTLPSVDRARPDRAPKVDAIPGYYAPELPAVAPTSSVPLN